MPGWRVHKYADEVFFGKSYSKIHRRMDAPVVYLGKSHRVLFHDSVTASIIATDCYPGDPNALALANLYILLDNICSSDPAFKKYLERMAILDRKKKKTTQKQIKKSQ